MFGQRNDIITQDQQSDAHVPLPDDTINDLTNSTPADPSDQPAGAPPVQHHEAIGSTGQTIQPQQPTAKPDFTDSAQSQSEQDAFPAASNDLAKATESHADMPTNTPAPTEHHDDLLAIKQNALSSLSPLVHNLELEAEEKFKTLMMLIQASDNHSLVKEAYEAAQAIPDEKVRAQALLDVVNEINYFTHSKDETKD